MRQRGVIDSNASYKAPDRATALLQLESAVPLALPSRGGMIEAVIRAALNYVSSFRLCGRCEIMSR